MNVIYASDDTYAQHMGISIFSLLKSNADMDEITINIIDDGLSNINKNEIERIVQSFSRECIFVDAADIKQRIYFTPMSNSPFPSSAYARLFVADNFSYDKALYLDCDIIINGSLKEIWEIDLDEYLIAGVQDVIEPFMLQYARMKDTQKYVNSGVLLLNLKKWRQDNLIKKIEEYVKLYIVRNSKAIEESLEEKSLPFVKISGSTDIFEEGKSEVVLLPYPDQNIINGVCNERLILHPKYNVTSSMMLWKDAFKIQKIRQIKNYYTRGELREAVDNPVIIHHTTGVYGRPWQNGCTHPLKNIYLDLLSQTIWQGKIQPQNIARKDRIKAWMYDNLPFSLYMLLEMILRIRRNRYYKLLEHYLENEK